MRSIASAQARDAAAPPARAAEEPPAATASPAATTTDPALPATTTPPSPGSAPDGGSGRSWSAAQVLADGPQALVSPDKLPSALQGLLLLAVLSLAPAIMLMTTSFVRIAVVLALLRQALGTQQLPPPQVMTSLALFMTLVVMTPVWTESYQAAVVPYTDPDVNMSLGEAWQAGIQPVRRFMSRQIEITGNSDDVWLFLQYVPDSTSTPQTYDDVPLQALLPAFLLSELKTAFLIGFQIYLPFLLVDLVVSSVTMSMGMVMLPPAMISLPLKLLLFVLVDGWHLVVGMLLESFSPYT